MAKKTKGNRIQVILECTEHKETGMAGTSRYITTKNRKNTPDRMEIKKFNPVLKKYTLHKVVATLQKGGGKEHTKVIKMIKSEKTGSYTFKEEIVHNDKVKEWFDKN